MKKIKKGLCALSLAVSSAAAFTIPMFSGCGEKPEQQLEQNGYEFVSIDGGTYSYYQDDVFSLDGRNMTIKDKKTNENIIIPLSNSMIKGGVGSIDMTTGGEKEITVTYDGKEYSFVITVVEKTAQGFADQLAALLRKYQSDSIKSVDISASLQYNARFLNQTSSQQTTSLGQTQIAKSDINQISASELEKAFAKELFEAITNSLVTSSLSAPANNIVNARQNKVSVDWLTFASNLLMQTMVKPNLSYALGTTISAQEAAEKIVELINEDSKEFLLNMMFATETLMYNALLSNSSSYENFQQQIYGSLKGYFDALASGSTEELTEFVSEQTNSQKYLNNLREYGTPYFLYEARKDYYDALFENFGNETSPAFVAMKPYFDVFVNFYKNVDEFAIYEGDFGDYVYEAMKEFASELYETEVDEEYKAYVKYNIVALSELLNVIFNGNYENEEAFLSLLLKEDALGDICYDIMPSIFAAYLNNQVFAYDNNFLTVSDPEAKALFKTTLDKIKNSKSFQNFTFFTDAANLLLGTGLNDGKFVVTNEEIAAAVKEFAGNLDEMVSNNNFSGYLNAQSRLASKLADIDVQEMSYAKMPLELSSIMTKMADLIIYGQVDDLSGFMIEMMNNEFVGEDFVQYLSMAVGAAFMGGTVASERYGEIVEEVVIPAFEAVKAAGNFENFDLMQRYYNHEIASSTNFSADEKQAIQDVCVSTDQFIAGTIDLEEFIVDWVEYLNFYATNMLDKDIDYMGEQAKIVFNVIKTLTGFGINVDAFVNNLTPAGLTDLLNNTFHDVMAQYVGGDTSEFEQNFATNFVTPFVQMLTDGDELNFSQFDLKNAMQYFIDFGDSMAVEPLSVAMKNAILTLADINNPEYLENLTSLENITNTLILLTQTQDRYEMAESIARMIYLPYGTGIEDTFVRKFTDLFNDIYDDIENGSLNIEQRIDDVKEFADGYLTPDARTTLYALGAIYLVATDQDVDYNEILSFIELPEGVTVDYNKMIEKIQNRTTFENIFSISNIETKLVTSQDNLIEEIVEITFSVDCDVEIAAIEGEFTLKLVLQK